MPIYTYRCENGHTQEELILRTTDEEPIECGECRAPLAREHHSFGIRFRSAGFHNTDYRPKPLPKGFGEKW